MTLVDKLLIRFRGPEAKRYWTEVLILLGIGFPICGSCMFLSIFTAIKFVDVQKNYTDIELLCGLTLFVFIPFLFGFIMSSLVTDAIMKRIPITLSQGGKEE